MMVELLQDAGLITDPPLPVDAPGPPDFKSNGRFAKPMSTRLTLLAEATLSTPAAQLGVSFASLTSAARHVLATSGGSAPKDQPTGQSKISTFEVL